MSTAPSLPPADNAASSKRAIAVCKWLTLATALGILIQAVLGSQGTFKNHPSLISGHAQLGNLLFVVVVIQAFLALQASNARLVPRWIAGLNVLQILFVVIQIGLGYSTRNNFPLVAWHIPNGVLLMGTCTVLASLAWSRTPGPTRQTARSPASEIR